jgi:hypothetical protein
MYNICAKYNKELWMTETSGFTSDWSGTMDLTKALFLALKFGNISAWTYWQMSGDILVDNIPNSKYYAFKNFYKFIRPGAYQVYSNSSNPSVLVIAFKHPTDSRLTFVLINNSNVNQNLKLSMENLPLQFDGYRTSQSENFVSLGKVNSSSFQLTPGSITTLVHDGNNKIPTVNKVPQIAILNSAGPQEVNLSGISDGGDGGQQLSMTASVADTTVISKVEVIYNSPESTAVLKITPKPNLIGHTSITISLNDNGAANDNHFFSEKTISFPVYTIASVNHSPTADSVPDQTMYAKSGDYILNITGISDGDNDTQSLTFSVQKGSFVMSAKSKYFPDQHLLQLTLASQNSGDANLSVIIKDNGDTLMGGQNTKTVSFKVHILQPSALESLKESDIKVYPNPAHDFLNVESTDVKFVYYSITNSLGLKEKSGLTFFSGQKMNIPLYGLPKGLYILTLCGDQQNFQSKFVIQ